MNLYHKITQLLRAAQDGYVRQLHIHTNSHAKPHMDKKQKHLRHIIIFPGQYPAQAINSAESGKYKLFQFK